MIQDHYKALENNLKFFPVIRNIIKNCKTENELFSTVQYMKRRTAIGLLRIIESIFSSTEISETKYLFQFMLQAPSTVPVLVRTEYGVFYVISTFTSIYVGERARNRMRTDGQYWTSCEVANYIYHQNDDGSFMPLCYMKRNFSLNELPVQMTIQFKDFIDNSTANLFVGSDIEEPDIFRPAFAKKEITEAPVSILVQSNHFSPNSHCIERALIFAELQDKAEMSIDEYYRNNLSPYNTIEDADSFFFNLGLIGISKKSMMEIALYSLLAYDKQHSGLMFINSDAHDFLYKVGQ